MRSTIDIIVVSKLNSIGSQSSLKNEHIMQYLIKRKTLNRFTQKVVFSIWNVILADDIKLQQSVPHSFVIRL